LILGIHSRSETTSLLWFFFSASCAIAPLHLIQVLFQNADKSIEKGKKRGGAEMNITSLDTGGDVQVFSAAAAPSRDAAVRADDGGETATLVSTAASGEQIRQMAAEIESQLAMMNVSLEFSRYGEHGEKIAVVVADRATGEVIREIPSREIQNLYKSISDLVGIIFDRQA
jgi:flagellar protein FlaG